MLFVDRFLTSTINDRFAADLPLLHTHPCAQHAGDKCLRDKPDQSATVAGCQLEVVRLGRQTSVAKEPDCFCLIAIYALRPNSHGFFGIGGTCTTGNKFWNALTNS